MRGCVPSSESGRGRSYVRYPAEVAHGAGVARRSHPSAFPLSADPGRTCSAMGPRLALGRAVLCSVKCGKP